VQTANGTPFTWRSIIGADQSATIGWSFSVGAVSLQLTALGIYDHNGDGIEDAHPVGIWTAAGALLAQATVPAGTAGTLVGSYRYVTVAPLTLSAGQTYVVGTYFGPVIDRCGSACGDASLVFGTETFDPRITFLQSRQNRAIIGGGSLAFPNLDAGVAGGAFFGPNFLLVSPSADLSITKTDGVTTATPGTTTTYTLVASNAGPDTATGASVTDTFPAACASVSYTSVAAGGATGNTAGPASGNINDTALTLPVGASVTYTATCNIAPTATGTLANTATIASSTTDPTPGNNSATDTDTLTQLATLAIQLDAPGSAPTTFNFTTVGLTPAAFSLQHGQTQTFTNLIPGQSYVVNDQPPPPGWVLGEVLCSAPAPQCVISSITLTPTAGQTVTGTFRFLRLTDAAEAIPIFSVWGLSALIGLFGLALARLRRRV
jgi:uncharacterized repeat protein (TIGR01451 family)